MEASLPAGTSLAPPAAGHTLPALLRLPARASPAGWSRVSWRYGSWGPLVCRKAILGDWRLVTVHVRTTSGVLSDWLRGCDPKMTREEFTACWCHRNVLCAVGEAPDAQLSIPWRT
ncbi:g11737 [Coccomyxa elongata]